MRLLRYVVSGQNIDRASDCDFSNIVRGTKNYLHTQFTFDGDWDGCVKMAIFDEEHAVRLDEDNKCPIPEEVLDKEAFSVRVKGISMAYTLQTNRTIIRQVR